MIAKPNFQTGFNINKEFVTRLWNPDSKDSSLRGFNVTTIFVFIVHLCSLIADVVLLHCKQVLFFFSHVAKNMASASSKISFFL